MTDQTVMVLSGPTAGGKTEIAVRLAEMTGAEIINADSRQIYRGMEIVSAAPTAEDRQRAVHHFVSEIDPDEDYSAGLFGKQSRDRIREISARGGNILVCGGSGMYIEAVFGMIQTRRAADPELRKRIQRDGETRGWDTLWRELKELDPGRAAVIAVHDAKRISRALEIIESSGITPSRLYREENEQFPLRRIQAGLTLDRTFLEERINKRCRTMVEKGLVEETRLLLEKYDPTLNSLNSVGTREIISHLRGELTLQEAVDLIQLHTRQFAKRQMTWFRKYAPDREFEIRRDSDPEKTAADILDFFRQKGLSM